MPRNPQSHRARKWLISAGLAAGVATGAAGLASAATTSSSTTTAPAATAPSSSAAPSSNSSAPAGSATPPAGAPNPATMTHGPGETLLTGTTAANVKAAALAAVPGGTIIRVETDSAGSAYEAHMTKSDGTQVTVKLDSSFKVTGIEAGFGAGPGK
jgi:hypothetical protein